MNKTMLLVVAMTLSSALPVLAQSEPPNNTPHALACMKRYGFTYAQWRAYAVPAEKAVPYRQCRDAGARVRSNANGQSARATCLARAGVTEQEWQGRKASYAQGAFFKSCMTEHGQNVTVRRRDGSILY